jgi:hypothetical protein
MAEKKKWPRCEHLFGINMVRHCTKLGHDCPSPEKCVEMHGNVHYKPVEFKDSDKWNFWGF